MLAVNLVITDSHLNVICMGEGGVGGVVTHLLYNP